MSMKARRKRIRRWITALSLSVLLLGGWVALVVISGLHGEETAPPAPADLRAETLPADTDAVGAEKPEYQEEDPELPATVDGPPSEQVLATRRMVAAHSPLREPSVADPDSPENKQILQAMLAKALEQPGVHHTLAEREREYRLKPPTTTAHP